MKETNTGDNYTLFDLPDFDLKDINIDLPEVDFDLAPLDLDLPEIDFDIEGVDLDLNFDGLQDDKDVDFPVLDFTDIPGLDI